MTFTLLSPSDRRGSNPRPAAWEAAALPTELLSHRVSDGCFITNRHPDNSPFTFLLYTDEKFFQIKLAPAAAAIAVTATTLTTFTMGRTTVTTLATRPTLAFATGSTHRFLFCIAFGFGKQRLATQLQFPVFLINGDNLHLDNVTLFQ